MSTQAAPKARETHSGSLGFEPKFVHANLTTPLLYEHAVRRNEGLITEGGALVVSTSPQTGRSPNDKFVVEEPGSAANIWWEKNAKATDAHFERLLADVKGHLAGQEVFLQDLYGGADPAYRLPVRFVTPNAWQALFVRNMFIRPPVEDLAGFLPGFTVLHAPEFQADPARHGTRSSTFIMLHFGRRMALIGGTRYAGEMKKAIFTVLNYMLPDQGVLPMHCSANVGPDGDTAVFFGLSGTGKTTLSADSTRGLIGDDEHGWSDRGVFNFEGGCYAKVIKLKPETEPEIYATTRMFGTILENVDMDPDARTIDFDSAKITENTRASYPIHFIPNHVPSGMAGLPRNIVFLTADAFGVLPPIARLTPEQAMYHFLSGYTAKVAGTERGVTEPTATFSACFGAPFLPRHPGRLRQDAGRADREVRHPGLAGQHRVDRRRLRHRLPDQASLHPGDGAGGALRRAGQGDVPEGPGFRVRGPHRRPRGPRRVAQAAGDLERRRRLRRGGRQAGQDVPGQLREVRQRCAGRGQERGAPGMS